jgi:hypothetical protein
LIGQRVRKTEASTMLGAATGDARPVSGDGDGVRFVTGSCGE